MRRGVAVLASVLAGCATLPAPTIMPGYLDLPLKPGHNIEEFEGPPAQTNVSFTIDDPKAALKRYRDALQSVGWVEVGARGLLKKGEGAQARCVSVDQLIMVTADAEVPSRPRRYVVFIQENCPETWG